jgi:tagatose-6-phosphate ketose/aldose isomerase
VLTGSGSSLYVGECLVVPVQRALRLPVSAVTSGELLTHQDAYLAATRRGVVVSFARSGDSPESSAVVDEVLAARPAWHHLIITCNGAGRLARYGGRDGVRALVLDDRTCDRSLVMTSSFTNMAVAGSVLRFRLGRRYRTRIEQLAGVARGLLTGSTGSRPSRSRTPVRGLPGQRARLGSAREWR